MKKILIASNSLNLGGIETSLINLLKRIDRSKYEVTLVLEKKEGMFLEDVPDGINVIEYRPCSSNNVFIQKIKNLINRIKWIIRNYKRYDASVCYSTYSYPCGFLARSSSNNKTLFVHADYFQLYNSDVDKTKKFFNKIKIKKYNHIVFVSNESRIKIQDIFPNQKDKMITINNLIDSSRIIKLSKEHIDDVSKDNMTFLFVGRLDEEQKKVSRIIEIAQKLKNEKIDFWLLGDGPYRQRYEKQISKYKLKNIKVLGTRKNPYPYLAMCDYLLLVSDYEGFPVVYNESIILNTPIITTVDVSDDYVSIPDRFGVVCEINTDIIAKKIKELSNKKIIIKEKVDFDKLNNKRINQIQQLFEEK